MRRRRRGGDFTAREKERGVVRGGDLTGSGWGCGVRNGIAGNTDKFSEYYGAL